MTATPIRLAVFDMEGTLTASPTVWELMHLKVGTWESHGKPYWDLYRAGGLAYDEFARMDVAAWKGAAVDLLDRSVREVPLMPGCADLMAELNARGIPSMIISNGLERLALRLMCEFGLRRVMANRETVLDGLLTGEVELRVPFDRKAETMLAAAGEMGVAPENILAVGDGTADVAMFRAAGRSVAFVPENDRVAGEADHVVDQPDLRRLIPLL